MASIKKSMGATRHERYSGTPAPGVCAIVFVTEYLIIQWSGGDCLQASVNADLWCDLIWPVKQRPCMCITFGSTTRITELRVISIRVKLI